jgi:hypothetical protein
LKDNGRVFYYGRIDHFIEDYENSYKEINDDLGFSKQFQSSPKIIKNHNFTYINAGSHILCLVNKYGELHLFDDNEGLIEIRTSRKVSTTKFQEMNFYAISNDNRIIYEVFFDKNKNKNDNKTNMKLRSMSKNKPFDKITEFDCLSNKSGNNLIRKRQRKFTDSYFICEYAINPNYKDLILLDIPYFSKLLFFKAEANIKSKEEIMNRKRILFAYLDEESKQIIDGVYKDYSDNENLIDNVRQNSRYQSKDKLILPQNHNHRETKKDICFNSNNPTIKNIEKIMNNEYSPQKTNLLKLQNTVKTIRDNIKMSTPIGMLSSSDLKLKGIKRGKDRHDHLSDLTNSLDKIFQRNLNKIHINRKFRDNKDDENIQRNPITIVIKSHEEIDDNNRFIEKENIISDCDNSNFDLIKNSKKSKTEVDEKNKADSLNNKHFSREIESKTSRDKINIKKQSNVDKEILNETKKIVKSNKDLMEKILRMESKIDDLKIKEKSENNCSTINDNFSLNSKNEMNKTKNKENMINYKDSILNEEVSGEFTNNINLINEKLCKTKNKNEHLNKKVILDFNKVKEREKKQSKINLFDENGINEFNSNNDVDNMSIFKKNVNHLIKQQIKNMNANDLIDNAFKIGKFIPNKKKNEIINSLDSINENKQNKYENVLFNSINNSINDKINSFVKEKEKLNENVTEEEIENIIKNEISDIVRENSNKINLFEESKSIFKKKDNNNKNNLNILINKKDLINNEKPELIEKIENLVQKCIDNQNTDDVINAAFMKFNKKMDLNRSSEIDNNDLISKCKNKLKGKIMDNIKQRIITENQGSKEENININLVDLTCLIKEEVEKTLVDDDNDKEKKILNVNSEIFNNELFSENNLNSNDVQHRLFSKNISFADLHKTKIDINYDEINCNSKKKILFFDQINKLIKSNVENIDNDTIVNNMIYSNNQELLDGYNSSKENLLLKCKYKLIESVKVKTEEEIKSLIKTKEAKNEQISLLEINGIIQNQIEKLISEDKINDYEENKRNKNELKDSNLLNNNNNANDIEQRLILNKALDLFQPDSSSKNENLENNDQSKRNSIYIKIQKVDLSDCIKQENLEDRKSMFCKINKLIKDQIKELPHDDIINNYLENNQSDNCVLNEILNSKEKLLEYCTNNTFQNISKNVEIKISELIEKKSENKENIDLLEIMCIVQNEFKSNLNKNNKQHKKFNWFSSCLKIVNSPNKPNNSEIKLHDLQNTTIDLNFEKNNEKLYSDINTFIDEYLNNITDDEIINLTVENFSKDVKDGFNLNKNELVNNCKELLREKIVNKSISKIHQYCANREKTNGDVNMLQVIAIVKKEIDDLNFETENSNSELIRKVAKSFDKNLKIPNTLCKESDENKTITFSSLYDAKIEISKKDLLDDLNTNKKNKLLDEISNVIDSYVANIDKNEIINSVLDENVDIINHIKNKEDLTKTTYKEFTSKVKDKVFKRIINKIKDGDKDIQSINLLELTSIIKNEVYYSLEKKQIDDPMLKTLNEDTYKISSILGENISNNQEIKIKEDKQNLKYSELQSIEINISKDDLNNNKGNNKFLNGLKSIIGDKIEAINSKEVLNAYLTSINNEKLDIINKNPNDIIKEGKEYLKEEIFSKIVNRIEKALESNEKNNDKINMLEITSIINNELNSAIKNQVKINVKDNSEIIDINNEKDVKTSKTPLINTFNAFNSVIKDKLNLNDSNDEKIFNYSDLLDVKFNSNEIIGNNETFNENVDKLIEATVKNLDSNSILNYVLESHLQQDFNPNIVEPTMLSNSKLDLIKKGESKMIKEISKNVNEKVKDLAIEKEKKGEKINLLDIQNLVSQEISNVISNKEKNVNELNNDQVDLKKNDKNNKLNNVDNSVLLDKTLRIFIAEKGNENTSYLGNDEKNKRCIDLYNIDVNIKSTDFKENEEKYVNFERKIEKLIESQVNSFNDEDIVKNIISNYDIFNNKDEEKQFLKDNNIKEFCKNKFITIVKEKVMNNIKNTLVDKEKENEKLNLLDLASIVKNEIGKSLQNEQILDSNSNKLGLINSQISILKDIIVANNNEINNDVENNFSELLQSNISKIENNDEKFGLKLNQLIETYIDNIDDDKIIDLTLRTNTKNEYLLSKNLTKSELVKECKRIMIDETADEVKNKVISFISEKQDKCENFSIFNVISKVNEQIEQHILKSSEDNNKIDVLIDDEDLKLAFNKFSNNTNNDPIKYSDLVNFTIDIKGEDININSSSYDKDNEKIKVDSFNDKVDEVIANLMNNIEENEFITKMLNNNDYKDKLIEDYDGNKENLLKKCKSLLFNSVSESVKNKLNEKILNKGKESESINILDVITTIKIDINEKLNQSILPSKNKQDNTSKTNNITSTFSELLTNIKNEMDFDNSKNNDNTNTNKLSDLNDKSNINKLININSLSNKDNIHKIINKEMDKLSPEKIVQIVLENYDKDGIILNNYNYSDKEFQNICKQKLIGVISENINEQLLNISGNKDNSNNSNVSLLDVAIIINKEVNKLENQKEMIQSKENEETTLNNKSNSSNMINADLSQHKNNDFNNLTKKIMIKSNELLQDLDNNNSNNKKEIVNTIESLIKSSIDGINKDDIIDNILSNSKTRFDLLGSKIESKAEISQKCNEYLFNQVQNNVKSKIVEVLKKKEENNETLNMLDLNLIINEEIRKTLNDNQASELQDNNNTNSDINCNYEKILDIIKTDNKLISKFESKVNKDNEIDNISKDKVKISDLLSISLNINVNDINESSSKSSDIINNVEEIINNKIDELDKDELINKTLSKYNENNSLLSHYDGSKDSLVGICADKMKEIVLDKVKNKLIENLTIKEKDNDKINLFDVMRIIESEIKESFETGVNVDNSLKKPNLERLKIADSIINEKTFNELSFSEKHELKLDLSPNDINKENLNNNIKTIISTCLKGIDKDLIVNTIINNDSTNEIIKNNIMNENSLNDDCYSILNELIAKNVENKLFKVLKEKEESGVNNPVSLLELTNIIQNEVNDTLKNSDVNTIDNMNNSDYHSLVKQSINLFSDVLKNESTGDQNGKNIISAISFDNLKSLKIDLNNDKSVINIDDTSKQNKNLDERVLLLIESYVSNCNGDKIINSTLSQNENNKSILNNYDGSSEDLLKKCTKILFSDLNENISKKINEVMKEKEIKGDCLNLMDIIGIVKIETDKVINQENELNKEIENDNTIGIMFKTYTNDSEMIVDKNINFTGMNNLKLDKQFKISNNEVDELIKTCIENKDIKKVINSAYNLNINDNNLCSNTANVHQNCKDLIYKKVENQIKEKIEFITNEKEKKGEKPSFLEIANIINSEVNDMLNSTSIDTNLPVDNNILEESISIFSNVIRTDDSKEVIKSNCNYSDLLNQKINLDLNDLKNDDKEKSTIYKNVQKLVGSCLEKADSNIILDIVMNKYINSNEVLDIDNKSIINECKKKLENVIVNNVQQELKKLIDEKKTDDNQQINMLEIFSIINKEVSKVLVTETKNYNNNILNNDFNKIEKIDNDNNNNDKFEKSLEINNEIKNLFKNQIKSDNINSIVSSDKCDVTFSDLHKMNIDLNFLKEKDIIDNIDKTTAVDKEKDFSNNIKAIIKKQLDILNVSDDLIINKVLNDLNKDDSLFNQYTGDKNSFVDLCNEKLVEAITENVKMKVKTIVDGKDNDTNMNLLEISLLVKNEINKCLNEHHFQHNIDNIPDSNVNIDNRRDLSCLFNNEININLEDLINNNQDKNTSLDKNIDKIIEDCLTNADCNEIINLVVNKYDIKDQLNTNEKLQDICYSKMNEVIKEKTKQKIAEILKNDEDRKINMFDILSIVKQEITNQNNDNGVDSKELEADNRLLTNFYDVFKNDLDTHTNLNSEDINFSKFNDLNIKLQDKDQDKNLVEIGKKIDPLIKQYLQDFSQISNESLKNNDIFDSSGSMIDDKKNLDLIKEKVNEKIMKKLENGNKESINLFDLTLIVKNEIKEFVNNKHSAEVEKSQAFYNDLKDIFDLSSNEIQIEKTEILKSVNNNSNEDNNKEISSEFMNKIDKAVLSYISKLDQDQTVNAALRINSTQNELLVDYDFSKDSLKNNCNKNLSNIVSENVKKEISNVLKENEWNSLSVDKISEIIKIETSKVLNNTGDSTDSAIKIL